MNAREALYWALWDNYTADQKNAFIDALLSEHDMNNYERLRTAVWKWIIDANESRGYGIDVSDLQEALDRIGATCPEGLDSDG